MEKIKFKNRYNNEFYLNVNNPTKTNAILIIAHGAMEYFGRYTEFSKYLESNNIKVVGYDHISHGTRQDLDSNAIYFGKNKGYQLLIDDLEDVSLWAYQNLEKVPIIIFAHSMGSLIARGLSIQTKFNYDGIILCGSLHPKKTITFLGLNMAKLNSKINPKGSSNVLNKLVFGKLDSVLSYNEENIEKYHNDPFCGKPFSNTAVVDLLSLVSIIIHEANIEKMLKTNYFIVAGKEDPFSENNKQLIALMSEMDIARLNYKYKFYPNMKHEILNEKNNQVVYDDIVKFCLSMNK